MANHPRTGRLAPEVLMGVVLFWGMLLVVLPLAIGWWLGEVARRRDKDK